MSNNKIKTCQFCQLLHQRGINYEYSTATASQSLDNSHVLLQPLISSTMNQSVRAPINTAYHHSGELIVQGGNPMSIVYSPGSLYQQTQNNPQKEIDDAISLTEKLNKPAIVG